MPSPVGHAFGAVAAGLAVTPFVHTPRARWIQIGLIAALGMAPDLDLLFGRHRVETHSIGGALIAAAIAAAVRLPIARSRWTIFAATFAAWFSHALLDYFGADTSMPYGVMLWWPFSTMHFYAGWSVLLPISRRWHLSGTLTHNLLAALREVLILGPIAAVLLMWRARRRREPTLYASRRG